MDEALAEGTPADYHSPVVLYRSSENLAGRSRAFVYQKHQLHILELAFSVVPLFFTGPVQPFDIHYRRSLREEEIGKQQSLVEVASGIVAEVENQTLHVRLIIKIGGG